MSAFASEDTSRQDKAWGSLGPPDLNPSPTLALNVGMNRREGERSLGLTLHSGLGPPWLCLFSFGKTLAHRPGVQEGAELRGASVAQEILPFHFWCGDTSCNSLVVRILREEGTSILSSLSLTFPSRYFLTSFYTKYDQIHFILNTVSLMSVLIPKLPQLHGVRIFGINKY